MVCFFFQHWNFTVCLFVQRCSWNSYFCSKNCCFLQFVRIEMHITSLYNIRILEPIIDQRVGKKNVSQSPIRAEDGPIYLNNLFVDCTVDPHSLRMIGTGPYNWNTLVKKNKLKILPITLISIYVNVGKKVKKNWLYMLRNFGFLTMAAQNAFGLHAIGKTDVMGVEYRDIDFMAISNSLDSFCTFLFLSWCTSRPWHSRFIKNDRYHCWDHNSS